MSTATIGLAVSGGALRGAFNVGAVNGLAQRGITEFDAVSGTSAGALVAPFALLGKFDVLEEAFGTIAGDDVYRLTSRARLLFDAVQNFLQTGVSLPAAAGSFDPLRERIAEYLTDADWDRLVALSEAGRSLYITTVDLTARQLVYWSLKGPATASGLDDRLLVNKGAVRIIRSREELIEVMIASSTIPIAAAPVRMPDGHVHVDGGVQEMLPAWVCIAHGVDTLYAVTTERKKTAAEESLSQRLPIEASEYEFGQRARGFDTGKAILERTIEALLDESFADEVRYLFLFANRNRLVNRLRAHAEERGYREILDELGAHEGERFNLRDLVFIAPAEDLDAPDLEQADPEKLRAMIRAGYERAEHALDTQMVS